MIATLLALVLAATVNPANAVGEGRRLLAANECEAAAKVMQDAVPSAAALPDPRERHDAVAALQFYSALAFHDCRRDEQAALALREFFRVRPDAAKLDRARYDSSFIRLFDEVHAKAATAATPFDRFYPGFQDAWDPEPERESLALWGRNSAFLILASPGEREAWGRLRDDDARRHFVEEFWTGRDRGEILRRVSFANRAFLAPDEERGALTDRGRVFVLLGPPSRIDRRPLSRSEGGFIPRRSALQIDGTLERWVYFRAQLSHPIPASQVEFRFITQDGYGNNVMEKDSMALKVLADARGSR
jgi:GWxTD domain-containing protein